jgi:predicted PurR-regulated permease PerM
MTPARGVEIVSRIDLAAYAIAGAALLLVLKLHLLLALLTGLLVYESVHLLAPLITARMLSGSRAKLLAVFLLTSAIVGLISLAILGIISYFRAGGFTALLQKLAETVESSRDVLPVWVSAYLPDSTEEIRTALVLWLREHAGTLQVAGTEVGRGIAYVLIAMIIGALLSLHEAVPKRERRPLAHALSERAARLSQSFRRVVLAQGWISAVNTTLTWLYLAVALPLAGIDLPLVKTLVLTTFIVGLMPIIGNLISNTAIVIVSLSYSPYVALVSLAYLVTIHKLEYFLNARIIGSRIHSQAWELLIAMLVMEAAFGIAGLVAAPIYYAYMKNELAAKGLV